MLPADPPPAVRLWDLPVRLVHWSFVLLVPALWWTAENGELAVHQALGCLMVGLLFFRVLWGFVGSSTARFATFVKGPRAIGAYLGRKRPGPVPGHNPLGALSVLLLLGVLIAIVGLGLVAQDVDGLEPGPLSYLVSYETGDAAREWHETLFNLLLAVIILHIAAVLFYLLVKRDNLIGPMITGRRRFPQTVTAPSIAPVWKSVMIGLLAGSFAWWIFLGAPL